MGGKKSSTSPRQFAASAGTATTRRKLRERTGVAGAPRTLSAAVPAVAAETAGQPSPAHAPLPDEASTIRRIGIGRRGAPAMPQEIAPIAVRPSLLSGISEQSVVSHYEHIYGNAVRKLRRDPALPKARPAHLVLLSARNAGVRHRPARNAIISMAPYTTSPEPATRARPGRPLPRRWTAIHPPTITTLARPVIPTTAHSGRPAA
jgi:hypothetical protein